MQFGLRAILIAQAICAVFFGLLAVVGVFAVVAAFLATLLFIALSRGRKRTPLRRMIVDLLGGIVLPCLCLYYDPLVFRQGGTAIAGHRQVLAYLALALQMFVLAIWLAVGRQTGRFGGVFTGLLGVGAAIALGLGLVMLPISLIGLVMALIGVLGFVPFLTFQVFARNAAKAFSLARANGGARFATLSALLGAGLAVVIPLAANAAFGRLLAGALQSLPPPPFLLP